MIRIHHRVPTLGRVFAANQRFGETLGVVGVIKTVSAFDAQAFVVGRAIAALDKKNFVVFDVVGQLTTDTAIRANRLDLLVWQRECRVARRHECSGRACLNALATGHAGAGTHGVIHVKHNLGLVAAKRETNHIVDLLVATGAQTARALDTGIQIHGDGGVAQVRRRLRAGRKSRLAKAQLGRPLINLVVACVGRLGHVGLK